MPAIIWDWNGTLLNDIDLCITTINTLLVKRDLQPLTKEIYREVFTFPVKEYYRAVGFDFEKEDFAVPAKEFIELYDSEVKNSPLHRQALHVLNSFKKKGIRQFVLSAMKQNMLEKTLEHNGIIHFFEAVAGLNDHYAVSKIERGRQLLSAFNIQKENSRMVGDTIHDFEVAQMLGIKCILIANGHQSKARLKNTGAKVIPDLAHLADTLNFRK